VTLATWHLSNGANEKAQILMDRLYHLKEPKAPLLFHAQYRVAHLQLLFAEADNLSFKLFARNYTIAIRILSILRHPSQTSSRSCRSCAQIHLQPIHSGGEAFSDGQINSSANESPFSPYLSPG
jgi:hypothetical protein